MTHNRGVSLAELRQLFYIAMRHFGHNAEQQQAAWDSAMSHPHRALTCYRAIVNSLSL